MDFLQKMDFLMGKYGLNKLTLSQNSGIPYSTIVGWYKKGYEGLKLTTLRKLSDYFNTTLDYWINEDEIDPNYWKANGFIVNGEEMGHIQKYRLLSQNWKEAVDAVLDIGYREYEEQQTARKEELEPADRELKEEQAAVLWESRGEPEAAEEIMPDTAEMLVYVNPAAAGTPLYAESDFERLRFPADEVPCGADFGIRISGQSMEPTVLDGSIVWVRKVLGMPNGTVGVFMLNDSAVCKRFFKGPDGSVRLESDNPGFGPATVAEFDTLVTVGEVIGTA